MDDRTRGASIVGLLIALGVFVVYKLWGKSRGQTAVVTSKIGPVQSWYDSTVGKWIGTSGTGGAAPVPAQATVPGPSNVKRRAMGPAIRMQSANIAPDQPQIASSGAIWTCPVGAHPEEADDCTVWCVLDRPESQTSQGDATDCTGSPKTLPAPWPIRGVTYDGTGNIVSGRNSFAPLPRRGPHGSIAPRFNA